MEDQPNWDPGVKKYFVKILTSLSYVIMWMMACATAGLYFNLGDLNMRPIIIPIIFYVIMAFTLILLIRYLYRTWKNG